MSRDINEGASGPEAFTLLRRRLKTHFNRVDTGQGYTRLHSFGVCIGTPYCDFSREFRVLVWAVTGSERTLAPGVDVVLQVVRMAVNGQFPTLMPTLHPGSMTTDPKPYASLDNMWKTFIDLANNKTPAVNGEKYFSLPVCSSGAQSSAPSGPRSAGHGRGQGGVPFQTPSWQTGSSHNSIVMPVNDPTDPWTDQTSNCWPWEDQRYAAPSKSAGGWFSPAGASCSLPVFCRLVPIRDSLSSNVLARISRRALSSSTILSLPAIEE